MCLKLITLAAHLVADGRWTKTSRFVSSENVTTIQVKMLGAQTELVAAQGVTGECQHIVKPELMGHSNGFGVNMEGERSEQS